MGAWGTGHFDNDTACDWVYELEDATDLKPLERAIGAVFADPEGIDADVGAEALAAIDTLARLNGKFGVQNAYTEGVDHWVSHMQLRPPQKLIEKARQALALIQSEQSELCELWSESEDFAAWQAEVQDLSTRLGA